MIRLACLAVLAGGCSFSPAALPMGTSADASMTADGTAGADGLPGADGPPVADGPVADAAAGDAAGDSCPVASKPITLGMEQHGNLTGQSRYEPTCTLGSPTGPVDIWRLDLGSTASSDLVVEVTPHTGLDAVVDVTQTCQGAPGVGTCGDLGGPDVPEVAVVPSVQPGRRFIAIDAFGDTQGLYDMVAFTRSIVSEGATCRRELDTSRCPLAHYCLDVNDDGVPTCELHSIVLDPNANDTACTTTTRFTDDGVFSGLVNDGTDVDVVELAPAAARALQVVVTDDSGTSCSADLQLELLEGNDCDTATVVASDDNSGLGPCPRLGFGNLGTAKKHWLRVSLAPGARVHPGAGYAMIIDFLPL